MSVAMPDGQVFSTGEARTPFSIQSISKLFSLELAMRIHGDAVWSPIGKEPSGASFNSLVLLEHENPRDPFINAGALAIVDLARRDAQWRKTRVQLPSIQARLRLYRHIVGTLRCQTTEKACWRLRSGVRSETIE
jgi:glutaminase